MSIILILGNVEFTFSPIIKWLKCPALFDFYINLPTGLIYTPSCGPSGCQWSTDSQICNCDCHGFVTKIDCDGETPMPSRTKASLSDLVDCAEWKCFVKKYLSDFARSITAVLKAFLLMDDNRFRKNASRGWNGRKRTISWYREIDIQRVRKEEW